MSRIIRKNISIIMSLIMLFSVVIPFDKVYAKKYGLVTGIIVENDSIVRWDNYEGAAYYHIHIYFAFDADSHESIKLNLYDCSVIEVRDGNSFDFYEYMKEHNTKFPYAVYSFGIYAYDSQGRTIADPASRDDDFLDDHAFYYYYHPPLDAPSNIRWDGTLAKWDSVENATEYKIYLESDGEIIHSDVVHEGLSYDFKYFISDTTKQYYFYVYSVDGNYQYDKTKSENSEIIQGIPYPYRDIENISLEKGMLTWNAYEDEDIETERYVISVDVGNGCYLKKEVNTLSLDLKELLKTNDVISGNYHYCIYAEDDKGFRLSNIMEGVYEGYINEELLAPTNVKWKEKIASWDYVENADSYTVRLYRDNSLVCTKITENVTYDFSSYIKNTAKTYYFSVEASDSTGDYKNSSIVNSNKIGFISGLLVSLKQVEYIYDGMEHKPIVTLKDSYNNYLKEGVNYEVEYPDDCVSVGEKRILIHGISEYIGEIETYYQIKEKPIHIHEWSEPVYKWSDDFKTVTAYRYCITDTSHSESETVFTSSEVKIEPKVGKKGTTEYKAEFVNSAFSTQIKEVENIPALVESNEKVDEDTYDKNKGNSEYVSKDKANESVKKYKKGDIVYDYDSNAIYEIFSDRFEVKFIGLINKKTRKVVIPNYILISDNKYIVTSVDANVLKNNKSIKSIIVGKNVKKIGKKAFYGCKNLKTIIIKTKKLKKKSIGAKAFKGINKKAKFKVPKKKLKLYKKLIKKAKAPKKCKITK